VPLPLSNPLFPFSHPPLVLSPTGIVGTKSPLFRIDKAIKAVQNALLEGDLGEDVSGGAEARKRKRGVQRGWAACRRLIPTLALSWGGGVHERRPSPSVLTGPF